MCGLAGFIDLKQEMSLDGCQQVAQSMASTLSHRGPDASGVWVDPTHHVALAHRRLSIIDLSDFASQPMQSPRGRYVGSYNGEIYNFPELKSKLERQGAHFTGYSDTAVALTAIEYWGIEAALKQFVGMFAMALWDRKDAVLTLIRDRIGEKPLYYAHQGRALLFASELKAFKAYPGWHGEIDRNALALYMRHNTIPAPWSIFKDVRKVKPGHLVQISYQRSDAGKEIFSMPGRHGNWIVYERSYWSLEAICDQRQVLDVGDAEQGIEELATLLEQSVRGQMLSDVPLGAFLSGGIDSSTVVAVMQSISSRPIQTFSIGFVEEEYNEAPYAANVARHLGTDHTEIMVTSEEAMAVIPQLASVYDEPFADSSQIPTWLVSKLAKQQVTVALSGDGGDELFAGYDRYGWAQRISHSTGRLPIGLRRHLAVWMQWPSVERWDHLSGLFGHLLGALGLEKHPGHKIHRLANMLDAQDPVDLYRTLVSHWEQLDTLVIGSAEYPDIYTDIPGYFGPLQEIEQYMALDLLTYLPDDILTKVDRASMANSLEVRVPLLDHRLIEYAWSMPLQMKLNNGQTKWPLREILRRYVPDALIDRPKMGFGVPIDHWLRGPLRTWAEDLMDKDRLREQGFFSPAPIRERWQEHLTGHRNWQHHLGDVLMIQSWLEEQ